MARDNNQQGEFALVRAARALDQAGAETVPDKLDRILNVLEVYPGGSFHAAEELIVRWLLKNMNSGGSGASSSSADGERLRRYPTTWRILEILFSSVPLFSLAKSLADRRFVAVLQATVKDLSESEELGGGGSVADGDSSPDTEMGDADAGGIRPRPSKRTKIDPVSFDLETQRQPSGTLRSADALFASLRSLLGRLGAVPDDEDSSNDGKQAERMGAEHIKSLFSSHSGYLKDILAPALLLCDRAMGGTERDSDAHRETWISTVSDLLDLHIKKDGVLLDVATHLSRTSLRMLGRLTGAGDDRRHGLSDAVGARWVRDLRRFLTRNLVLPARAEFASRGAVDAIATAAQIASPTDPACYTVILDLALSAPRAGGSAETARRQNQAWIQAVFDLLQESLRGRKSSQDDKRAVLLAMLDLLREESSTSTLSAESLRSACRRYALLSDGTAWDLLCRAAEIDADVFFAEQELLKDVLGRTGGDDPLSEEDLAAASSLVVTLAAGFARARELSEFVTRWWFRHLVLAQPHLEPQSNRRRIWYNAQLNETVAQSLQRSMNTKQVSSLVHWLDSQQREPAEDAAVELILAAVSRAITEDELVDAVGTRVFDAVFTTRDIPPASAPDEVLACRWAVAERCFGWAALDDVHRMWTRIAPELKDALKKLPLAHGATLPAFRAAVAAWLATHPGARHEDDAAAVVCTLVGRLSSELSRPDLDLAAVSAPYVDFILDGSPRLLSLIVERTGKLPAFLAPQLSAEGDLGDRNRAMLLTFVSNENNANSKAGMDHFLAHIIGAMGDDDGAGWSSPTTRTAIEYLLATPTEPVVREHREQIMSILLRKVSKAAPAEADINRALSLMIKMMRRPTFYPKMRFGHLDTIAACLAKLGDSPDAHHTSAFNNSFVPLLKELALLTTRQMTSNIEKREQDYLLDAASLPSTWSLDKPGGALHTARVVLLAALISSLEQSPVALKVIPELDIGRLKLILGEAVRATVNSFCSTLAATDAPLAPLLVALDAAASALDRTVAHGILLPSLPSLVEAAERPPPARHENYWDLKRLLAEISGGKQIESHTGSDRRFPPLHRRNLAVPAGSDASFDRSKILAFVDAAIRDADEDAKLAYLQTLLSGDAATGTTATSQLLSAYRVVQHIDVTRSAAAATSRAFDLASAHNVLCERLRRSETAAEFALASRILCALLDKPPGGPGGGMTQWNVELTLSTVAALASAHAAARHPVVSTHPATAYRRLCLLVQAVLRRHRLRLEGRFHLVVAVLQSLLRCLLRHPHDDDGAPTRDTSRKHHQHSGWAARAALFSRLLTLVCEPSAASVSRSRPNAAAATTTGSAGPAGPLDSAADAARRSAGSHMYQVLMLYVRLQLGEEEGATPPPPAVREALEPGLFAVLDITSPDGRRIMADAMDAGGRTVMRALYKQYLKFGKWTGV